MERIKDKIRSADPGKLSEEEIEGKAKRRIKEYNIHIEGVKDLLKGINMNVIDANREDTIVLEEIARIIRLQSCRNVPKRAPRILLSGPPGSGRSTYARMLSEHYKMIHIQPLARN